MSLSPFLPLWFTATQVLLMCLPKNMYLLIHIRLYMFTPSFKGVLFDSRNLKGGIGSLFDPCVNAMKWRPYWPSHMEVSYCTFGFCANILRDLCTISLPRDSHHACVIKVHAGKATHACLAGLATKISEGTITHLHTWRQDGRHNRFTL